ncbi:MAG: tRNA pseudouridine(55) synthase TruB [Clostridia bacterium]|jgi:tRNA pseudouridine55 synthase
MNGIINVLKPPGMTSSDVVVFLRKLLKIKKIGHTGTLDPGAAGVLPICIGKATRLFDYIVEKNKTYIAEITLGITTDTQDAYGTIIDMQEVKVSRHDLERVVQQFIGIIEQQPPMYSAIKVKGEKLYNLARKGKTVNIPARRITVQSIQLLEQTADNRYLLKIECGKGTYIRTLCHDIGKALGCGAYMSFLLRSADGPFRIEDTFTLDEIENIALSDRIEAALLPLDFPIQDLPYVYVSKSYKLKLVNGNPISSNWIDNASDDLKDGQNMRLYCDNQFYGIGRVRRKQEGYIIAIQSLLR